MRIEAISEETHEVVAEQGEAGVVESGHRVKNRHATWRFPRRRRTWCGTVAAEEGHRALDHDGDDEDPAQHPTNVAQPHAPGLGRRGQTGTQSHPPCKEQGDQGGQGHDPEPADLDQRKDHRLPGAAPVGRGVNGGQPRDAHSARCREDRCDERRRALTGPRDRQHQQHGPDCSSTHERGDHDLGRVPKSEPAGGRPSRHGSGTPAKDGRVAQPRPHVPGEGTRPDVGLSRPTVPDPRRRRPRRPDRGSAPATETA